MLRYSTSALDRDMVYCFLDFQATITVPSCMQYHVTDFLVTEHEAQSLSQYAVMEVTRFFEQE